MSVLTYLHMNMVLNLDLHVHAILLHLISHLWPILCFMLFIYFGLERLADMSTK